MSVARLVAMMAQTPHAQYIGSTTHNETLATVPLPVGAQTGDFCIVHYASVRTLSGGSGAAWTTVTDPQNWTKISARQLLAADITTPLVLNDVSPVIVMIWRGPVAITAARTSGTGSVASPSPAFNVVNLAGFSKSARSVAFAGFTIGVNASGELPQPPFQTSVNVGPTNLRMRDYSMTTMANYTDGATILLTVGAGPGSATAIVFELLG